MGRADPGPRSSSSSSTIWRRRRSLQWRVTVALFGVALAAVAMVATLAAGTTARQFGTYVERGPMQMMGRRVFGEALRGYLEAGSWQGGVALARRLGSDFQVRVVIRDASGAVVGDSDPRGPEPTAQRALVLADGTLIGFVQVGPTGGGAQERVFLSTTYRWLVVGALLAATLALIAGTAVSRRLTAPLEDLTEAARRMAAGAHDSRVRTSGDDELAELGNAFNEMAESVERSELLRRRLIGDVAHELRTPIATLRSRLEALRDGVLPTDEPTLATLSDEVLVLSGLVDDLQELSLAESGGLVYMRAPIDLGALVCEEAERFRVGLEARGVGLEVSCEHDTMVVGDAKRLGQVVRNLMDNAAKHTEAGTVAVACRRGASAADTPRATSVSEQAPAVGSNVAHIEVRDTGLGIVPEDLPLVFERFYRADTARERRRGGAGIGLTIAKRIVEDHGGTIEASSQVGRGTTMRVFLPLAAGPTSLDDQGESRGRGAAGAVGGLVDQAGDMDATDRPDAADPVGRTDPVGTT